MQRLPRLDLDPDARLLRWGWIAWGAVTLVLAVWFIHAGRAQLAIALFKSLFLSAFWIGWLVWRGGRALWHAVRTAPYRDWNGSYYEYDGRQVRVLFSDHDDALFVVAADVHAVLGLDRRATTPERVRAIAGRDGLVRVDGAREDVFTERGLAAWLERRTDERSASLRRWLDTQVIGPHRRKREH